MKIEDVDKAIELLYEYHYNEELLKKSEETLANIAVILDKNKTTFDEAEQFQYRKDIADNIQKLIASSKRDGCNFEHDVLVYGLGLATTKLEYRLKSLKQKIEKL